MVATRRTIRRFRDGSVVALGLAAIAMAVVYARNRAETPRSHRLTITAGQTLGLRHNMALRLAAEVRARGLRLDVRDSTGSDDALDLVEGGSLDLAMVQGGLNRGDRPHVRQVATLQVEPLHLLVKGSIHDDVSKNLVALRGKVVNLGEPGSGTARLSQEVLAFAGLRPGATPDSGGYTATSLTYADLEAITDGAKAPDAVFMVSSLPSRVARHLVARHGYRLVALPFGEAFSLDALMPDDDAPGRSRVDRIHIDEARIPAFTYGVDPGVPERAISTLGTRLLIVAHEDTDPLAVDMLLDAVYGARFAKAAKPALEASLLELPSEWPLHAGTLAHLARNKPLIASDVVDVLEKEVSLIGAAIGGLFFLWQGARRWYRRRRERGLESYLLKVMEVERRTLQQESSPIPSLSELLALQAELNALKGEAVRKFADGEIEGEELLSGFLTYANDARDSLNRLILHERDNLEELAQAGGGPPADAWNEAIAASASSETVRPIDRD